jgi:hypothetical protein
MNKSDSIKELSGALAKAQAAMPAVKFNSTNPFLKNKYADLGAVIETAQPILAKNGLSVTQLVFAELDLVGVETVLLHESGEWISASASLPLGDEKGKSMAQVAGSVVTYLRRYGLSAILGMYADEDGDGNGQQQQASKPAQPKPAAPQAQTQTGSTPPGNITPQMLVDNGISESIPAAAEVVNKLSIAGKPAAEFWGRVVLYRKHRQAGKDSSAAAVAAIAGEIPAEKEN